ncbi:MAG: hypothetical protein KDG89_10345 [Geminicoccaceae bacterium]|nr:hypothetical protein [Geminicoccaceae bacterium]
MGFANGDIIHAREDVTDEIDGVAMTLPAGAYRALPLPVADDADPRLLLLAVGHERVHPISNDALRKLIDDDGQPVNVAD